MKTPHRKSTHSLTGFVCFLESNKARGKRRGGWVVGTCHRGVGLHVIYELPTKAVPTEPRRGGISASSPLVDTSPGASVSNTASTNLLEIERATHLRSIRASGVIAREL